MAGFEPFKDFYDFDRVLDPYSDLRDDEFPFVDLQGMAFGICSYMRGYCSWPKIRKAYEDFKMFFGQRSMITKQISWSDFKGLNRREHGEQYAVYELLGTLYKYQTNDHGFKLNLSSKMRNVFRLKTPNLKTLNEIFEDSVNWDRQNPVKKPDFRLHPEVRKVVKMLKVEEKYGDLPMFSDMLEDYHGDALMDFAEHFRQGKHTYACKYLRVLEGDK